MTQNLIVAFQEADLIVKTQVQRKAKIEEKIFRTTRKNEEDEDREPHLDGGGYRLWVDPDNDLRLIK